MVEWCFIVIHEYDVTLGICFFIMRANIFYLTNDHKQNEIELRNINLFEVGDCLHNIWTQNVAVCVPQAESLSKGLSINDVTRYPLRGEGELPKGDVTW